MERNHKKYGRRKLAYRKKKNRGSAIIEITLLIPVFLGCIYLYIMCFLFFTESAKKMEQLSECLYTSDRKEDKTIENQYKEIQLRREGNMRCTWVEEQGKLFIFYLELRKDTNQPVENIRRWQLVTDTIQ